MKMSNLEGVDLNTDKSNIQPEEDKNKLAIWFFLGGEVILFGALIMMYAVQRITYAHQYAAFRSHLSIPLIGVNTLVLITSSYFVVRTFEAARQGRITGMLWNLVAVLALGSIFIGGQAYEWSTLFDQGIKLDSTFGAPFFIITGIHGTHVLIGLAWASIALFLGMGNASGSRHDRSVEIFGLYWHFVDIVWIILFSLIYLL
jgi:heme/copper-type cytochrome/quinol oxidase subunit 3